MMSYDSGPAEAAMSMHGGIPVDSYLPTTHRNITAGFASDFHSIYIEIFIT